MQQLSSSNQLVSNGMWSLSLQFCTRLFPTLLSQPYEIIVFLFKQQQSAEIFPRDPCFSPWLCVRISCHTSKMIQLVKTINQYQNTWYNIAKCTLSTEMHMEIRDKVDHMIGHKISLNKFKRFKSYKVCSRIKSRPS